MSVNDKREESCVFCGSTVRECCPSGIRRDEFIRFQETVVRQVLDKMLESGAVTLCDASNYVLRELAAGWRPNQ